MSPPGRRKSPRIAFPAEAAHDRAERLADELSEARQRIRELEHELRSEMELRPAFMSASDTWARCSWCGWEHKDQPGAVAAGRAHVLVCHLHPMNIAKVERDGALRDLRLACEARNKAVERAQELERRVAEEERYARAWAVLEVTANHAKHILESASRLSVSDFRNEMRALIDYAQSTVEDCQSADLSTMKQAAETPAEHFRRCGPFCNHVGMCSACVGCHSLCAAHASNPDGTFHWAKEKP